MKKKVLALAMALVLVCSMGAAFALNDCSTVSFSWSCPASKCGQGKIEVIPYVRVSNGCGGYDWQPSTCAAAISGENVYFALKLTVEANPNQLWWTVNSTNNKGAITNNIKLNSKGMQTDLNNVNAALPAWSAIQNLTKDTEYYFNFAEAGDTIDTNNRLFWDKVNSSFEFGDDNINHGGQWNAVKLVAKDARKAKVCATIKSEHDGLAFIGGPDAQKWEYNGYEVRVGTTDNWATGAIVFVKGGKTATIKVTNKEVSSIECNDNNFWSQVVADFNLSGCGVGVCVNADNVQANFGWDDEIESCFSWSSNGTAIVDPQCTVEIPKTGDVSVIAYAVMALVAAAGAMGLKK